MELDRIDLADIADPVRLAAALHRQLGHANGPVPVAEVAKALGILEVRHDVLDGCEGALLTDIVRRHGSILVNTRHGPGGRASVLPMNWGIL